METPSSSAENGAEWESLVGKAILRFGDVELVSIRLIAATDSSKSLISISRERFSDRASKLIEMLESRDQLSDSERALLDGYVRAKELSPIRNLIAHNPMMLDIYVNEDETEMHAEHSIRSLRSDDEFLDIAALKEFAHEIENLSANIWLHYCKVRGSSSDLWRLHDPEDRHK